MGGGEVVRYFSRHGGRGIVKRRLRRRRREYLLKTADNPDGIDAAVFAGIKEGVRKDRPNYLAGLLKDVFFDGPSGDQDTRRNSGARRLSSLQASLAPAGRLRVDAF